MVLRPWSHQSLENRGGKWVGAQLCVWTGSSDKRWDRCPLCQLGPPALHGGGPERSAPSQQLHGPPTPACSYQSKPLWMDFICTPCVALLLISNGAFQFSSLYRLFHELPTSFGVTADNPDQLQGGCDRWEWVWKAWKLRKLEQLKHFDTKFVHKLIFF